MSDQQEVVVATAQGFAEEEQIQAFLEAHGIPSRSEGEALRKTHAFVLDGLGEVRILVAPEHAESAAELLATVDSGDLALAEDEEVGP